MEHPAAKILVELADLQDQEVGDGTTSVVRLMFYKEMIPRVLKNGVAFSKLIKFVASDDDHTQSQFCC